MDQVRDAIGPGTISYLMGHGWIKALFGIRTSSYLGSWIMMSGYWIYGHSLGMRYLDLELVIFKGSILFANHKANGVVTNIGLSS